MGSTQSSKMPGGAAKAPPPGPWSSDMSTQPSRAPRPASGGRGSGPGQIYRDGLSGDGFRLSAPVGPGAANRPRDVYQVESILSGSGLLKRGPGSVFGDDTASAIGEGQRQLNRDHGTAVGRSPLKVDGLIKPEGPTQTTTRTLARQVSDMWKAHGESDKTLSPLPPKKPSSANPAPPRTREDDLDANIKRMQKAMSADQTGELQRLADGLSKSSKPGPAAQDISDAINKNGTKAIAEFSIIRDRLAESGSPEQVKALEKAVMNGVSGKGRKEMETHLYRRGEGGKPRTMELSGQAWKDAREGKGNQNLKSETLSVGTEMGETTQEAKNADFDLNEMPDFVKRSIREPLIRSGLEPTDENIKGFISAYADGDGAGVNKWLRENGAKNQIYFQNSTEPSQRDTSQQPKLPKHPLEANDFQKVVNGSLESLSGERDAAKSRRAEIEERKRLEGISANLLDDPDMADTPAGRRYQNEAGFRSRLNGFAKTGKTDDQSILAFLDQYAHLFGGSSQGLSAVGGEAVDFDMANQLRVSSAVKKLTEAGADPDTINKFSKSDLFGIEFALHGKPDSVGIPPFMINERKIAKQVSDDLDGGKDMTEVIENALSLKSELKPNPIIDAISKGIRNSSGGKQETSDSKVLPVPKNSSEDQFSRGKPQEGNRYQRLIKAGLDDESARVIAKRGEKETQHMLDLADVEENGPIIDLLTWLSGNIRREDDSRRFPKTDGGGGIRG